MVATVRIAGPFGGPYRAWCPALPGCAVYGRSRREVRARIRQAVLGYLEHLAVALPRELARHTRMAPGRRLRGHHEPEDV
jgi:predicted RNase H-like HicB family nuclease